MLVSVIIPVYKRSDWLKRCLEALRAQNLDMGTWETIIVDDGSPNQGEIRKVVEDAAEGFPGPLRLLRKQNAGPAAARNHGVQASRGEVLCFLDDDSLPDSGWSKEISTTFSNSEKVGLVSGKTLSFNRRCDSLSFRLEKAVYSGKCWATCNIAYRRLAFESLGGFDETFPEPSWEDNDLGLRARWAGYLHGYNKNAIVFHPHEESIQEYRTKCLLNGRGAAVFSRKYFQTRPVWSIAVPILMSRRLFYAFAPPVWFGQSSSNGYLKFLWSFYSVRGYLSTLTGRNKWKKPGVSKS